MKPEDEPRRRGPAPASLIPLPSFLRTSFALKGPVPVAVEPGFLLLMGYIGYVVAGSPARENFAAKAAIAAVVAALSILWHECGHAAAVLAFGGRPKITLVATGGNTTLGKVPLTFWRELIISASGPLAGFLLCALAGGALRLDAVASRGPLLFFAFAVAKVLNWIWSLLNLVPALPMDGGNMLRIVFQRFFGPAGRRHAFRWSIAGCAGLAVYGLWNTDWLLAFFAFSMAAGNRSSLRALTQFSDAEQTPAAQSVISQVAGLEKEAKWSEAYALMLPLEPVLGPRNTCALALLACRTGRHQKAVELCEPLYKKRGRDYSIAFLLARAYAGREDLNSAVKWLKQASADGLPNASAAVASSEEFKTIKDAPAVRAALFPLSGLKKSDPGDRL